MIKKIMDMDYDDMINNIINDSVSSLELNNIDDKDKSDENNGNVEQVRKSLDGHIKNALEYRNTI